MIITSEWAEQDTRIVCDGLIKHNRSHARPLDEQWSETINVILKTDDGQVVGGIMCNMFMYTLDIDVLWVDEKYRNQGYGARLIEEAEKIAKSMGCIMVMTSTFSYQAPRFYPKCGFETYAVLEGFPEGIKQYRFKKLI